MRNRIVPVEAPSEERLRQALASGDFSAARYLLPDYSAAIAEFVSGPASKREKQQAIESFHNLLSLARVVRAHIGAQSSQLQRQSSYQSLLVASDRHTWRFEA